MKILFIDTSSKLAKVHFIDGDRIVTKENFGEKSHSISLLAMIDEVLPEGGVKNIDCVAVANGPGSYTGLRIAIATAKTLAYSLGKPLVCINTLLYIAASNAIQNSIVVPMIDARNNQAFYGIYESDENCNLRQIGDLSATDVNEICKMAESHGKNVIYCGDGANNILGKDSNLGNGEAAKKLVLAKFDETRLNDFLPEKAEAYYMKDVHVTLKNNG